MKNAIKVPPKLSFEVCYLNKLNALLLKAQYDEETSIPESVLTAVFKDSKIGSIFAIESKKLFYIANSSEEIINNEYLLLDWVQSFGEPRGRYTLREMLVRLKQTILNQKLEEYQLSVLKETRTLPEKIAQGDWKFTNFEEITQKQAEKYIELSSRLKKVINAEEESLKEAASRVELFLNLTKQEKILSQLQLAQNEILEFFFGKGKRRLYKIEIDFKRYEFVVIMVIEGGQKPQINFDINLRTQSSIKTEFDESLKNLVKKVDKSKIFQYSRPYTQKSLELVELEYELFEYLSKITEKKQFLIFEAVKILRKKLREKFENR